PLRLNTKADFTTKNAKGITKGAKGGIRQLRNSAVPGPPSSIFHPTKKAGNPHTVQIPGFQKDTTVAAA
ncbi:MAG: hypothetical protein LAT75_08890, partial [Candidatus Cyclonatronum sp.]|uniref:hypothetical protein n=1 Tax=Cyclonatronum sp. TaxID=3024185 RepID=UPI0025BBC991